MQKKAILLIMFTLKYHDKLVSFIYYGLWFCFLWKLAPFEFRKVVGMYTNKFYVKVKSNKKFKTFILKKDVLNFF